MPQPRYDIEINQNATFRMAFTLTDISGSLIDLSNLEFIGSIKNDYLVDDPPFLLFTSSIDYVNSAVSLYLSHTQTEQLVEPRYLYDVISVDNTVSPPDVVRLLEGVVRVRYGITDTDPSQ